MTAAFAAVKARWADLLSTYQFHSNTAKHHFCARCGSPLYSHAAATAEIVSLRCGTLDGDPGLRPTAHLHAAAKAPWTEIADALGMPEPTGAIVRSVVKDGPADKAGFKSGDV